MLAAAGEQFVVTGYAETSSKAIAGQAQVDLASINYHFGNRSGLYQAVLARCHAQLLDMSACSSWSAASYPRTRSRAC